MKKDPKSFECMAGGKLVAEWLLRESLKWKSPACSCSSQMAGWVLSVTQSAYATISYLSFLRTKSYQQRQQELGPETLGLGQNDGTSVTQKGYCWRDISRLFGLWATHNLPSVDCCSLTPKPVALCRCDLQGIRGIWLWPLAVGLVLLCSCTRPELAS